MTASVSTRCNAPLPNVSILEVMPGNHQQDNLNKQLARRCYFEFSTCSKVALRFSLLTVDRTGGWKAEGGHITNGAACSALCANSSEPQ